MPLYTLAENLDVLQGGGGTQNVNIVNTVPLTLIASGTQNVNIVSGTMSLVQSGAFDVTSNSQNLATEATQVKMIAVAPTSVFVFLASGSQQTQASFLGAPRTGLVAAISGSKVFSLRGDPLNSVWYRFSTATTGSVIDPGDNLTAAQCDILFAGDRQDFTIPLGTNSLIMSASSTSYIRLSVTS